MIRSRFALSFRWPVWLRWILSLPYHRLSATTLFWKFLFSPWKKTGLYLDFLFSTAFASLLASFAKPFPHWGLGRIPTICILHLIPELRCIWLARQRSSSAIFFPICVASILDFGSVILLPPITIYFCMMGRRILSYAFLASVTLPLGY